MVLFDIMGFGRPAGRGAHDPPAGGPRPWRGAAWSASSPPGSTWSSTRSRNGTSAGPHRRPSSSTPAPSRRAPRPPSTSRSGASTAAGPAIVLEHVTRLRDDLAPEWPQPAGHGCYRVTVSGEPNYTLDLQLLGSDGDHNTAGLKATAMRLVNAVPAVVEAPPGPAHRARPPPDLRTRPGPLTASRSRGRGRRTGLQPVNCRVRVMTDGGDTRGRPAR